eukprot:TRINITY_DN34282_c0_g1_i1.p2 TRINITY_DN34282_c0_g1~~TRINITY_DN34282_c0_g1_i1.p2  ORF type:complete len:163 (-),score=1.60 TRINITY_DN34282_c0_g1_i1:152-640(-)
MAEIPRIVFKLSKTDVSFPQIKQQAENFLRLCRSHPIQNPVYYLQTVPFVVQITQSIYQSYQNDSQRCWSQVNLAGNENYICMHYSTCTICTKQSSNNTRLFHLIQQKKFGILNLIQKMQQTVEKCSQSVESFGFVPTEIFKVTTKLEIFEIFPDYARKKEP